MYVCRYDSNEQIRSELTESSRESGEGEGESEGWEGRVLRGRTAIVMADMVVAMFICKID